MIQVKPLKELIKEGIIEKLEIERRYWEFKEILWSIVTEQNIPTPASAFSGNVQAIQLHHPTGAAVPSSPHNPNRMATMIVHVPNMTKASTITSIMTGMRIRAGYLSISSQFMAKWPNLLDTA